MESAVQHGAAAFVAGLQATGAEGNPAQARGAWMMVSVGTGSSTIVISGTGRPTTVTESSTTLYKEQPGTVRTILIALAIALVISTASVVGRVVRRSERLGVT